jgi:hypothetical protein
MDCRDCRYRGGCYSDRRDSHYRPRLALASLWPLAVPGLNSSFGVWNGAAARPRVGRGFGGIFSNRSNWHRGAVQALWLDHYPPKITP